MRTRQEKLIKAANVLRSASYSKEYSKFLNKLTSVAYWDKPVIKTAGVRNAFMGGVSGSLLGMLAMLAPSDPELSAREQYREACSLWHTPIPYIGLGTLLGSIIPDKTFENLGPVTNPTPDQINNAKPVTS